MEKKLCAVLFMIITSTAMTAQDFKGVIMNQKQRPLKGIGVWRKNTTESVKTDKLGTFGFPNLQETDTLVISVSKKSEIIIPVNRLKQVSIKIESDFYLLFDGEREFKKEYKRVLRANYNSNIVTREQILKLSANSIYEILQGSVSGVSVTNNRVSIRGGNSFELDTEPLFIVDGTQYDNSSDVDSSISVNDIEKVEVLKDGSTYGVKGSNGVIIISTIKK